MEGEGTGEMGGWRVEDGGWKKGVLDIPPALGLWLRIALPAAAPRERRPADCRFARFRKVKEGQN